MELFEQGPLFYMFIVWSGVTLGLILLVIYRGVLSAKEDDQIFLDEATSRIAKEQVELVARITRLSKPIWLFGVASGVLFVALAGRWVWEVMHRY